MSLQRKPDWPTRLHGFFEEHRRTRFAYGRMDCCLFVADAVLAMTGADLASAFRGQYNSRNEAMIRMKEYAGQASVKSVAQKLMAAHGLPEVPVLCAQRGDIVLVKRPRDYSLGLISLAGSDVVAIAKQGLMRLPLSAVQAAWRV